MRFMVMVKANNESEAGVMPTEPMLAEMANYNEGLLRAGVMLAGDGLQPSSKGARVRYSGGKFTVTDGPFAEAKELVAGYWILRAGSLEEAIDWLKRSPFQDGEVEIRQMFETDDFPVSPDEQPDGWREQEDRLCEQNAGMMSRPVDSTGEKKSRFMAFLKADSDTEAGVLPDEKMLTSMGNFIQEAVEAGVLLSGEGLHPSSKGARIQFSGSERTVIDGPFSEAKELIAGYAMIQASSKEEAIEWTKRFLEVDAPGRKNNEAECEVRQVFELEDFAPSEAVDHHARLRAEFEGN